ncbi:arginine methyl transferase [Dentipellis sp. KUC8613]|nr:arginine methyl transferase [Dentipellis sp. KUC8613]
MEKDSEADELVVLGRLLIDAVLARKPILDIRVIIDDGAPLWFQDEDGWSVLHAAANNEDEDLVKLLLAEGAIWNAIDNLGNSAGDIALSLNNQVCYRLIRDAGIRSELLLQLLSSKDAVAETMLLQTTDASAFGSTDAFISSDLKYTTDEHGQEICLLTTEQGDVGVMMGWERGIMRETVQKLKFNTSPENNETKVLNIGFGLGIIDTFLQEALQPSLHVIIEPHPDVLHHMRALGWYDKTNVQILEGKWQSFIDKDQILSIGGFDVIFTDTFSENYDDLQEFFAHLPDLLAGPDARFSFFNGLGATNALFYDVYTRLSELHLADVGIDVEWSDVDVTGGGDEKRWGETRKYFALPYYRLPVGRMK